MEWKNRKNSGIADAEAQALADATISTQQASSERSIANTLTIDNDSELRSKRDLLLSISGVGETFGWRGIGRIAWSGCPALERPRWSPMLD